MPFYQLVEKLPENSKAILLGFFVHHAKRGGSKGGVLRGVSDVVAIKRGQNRAFFCG